VKGEAKAKAEAASGIIGRREIPRPPRTSRGSSSTIQQVQIGRMDRPYRGETVPRGIEVMPTSRMLLSSHYATLGALMEAEGVVLDLARGALVGAKNTVYPVFSICVPSRRLHAQLPIIPSTRPPEGQSGTLKSKEKLGKAPSRIDCIRNLRRVGPVLCGSGQYPTSLPGSRPRDLPAYRA
jgi:hypothetical protein